STASTPPNTGNDRIAILLYGPPGWRTRGARTPRTGPSLFVVGRPAGRRPVPRPGVGWRRPRRGRVYGPCGLYRGPGRRQGHALCLRRASRGRAGPGKAGGIGCLLRPVPCHLGRLVMPDFTYPDIAKMLDHSLLQPTLTDADLEAGCRLAREYDVASVCIKPYAVRQAAAWLAGSTVAVGTTIGFPHGGHTTSIKVAESEQAMNDGARELDMVVNIGKALGKDWDYVAADVRGVVEAAHRRGALVKVIFENCFLQSEHKEQLCRICGEVGADFVKTSTGYGDSGATDDD